MGAATRAAERRRRVRQARPPVTVRGSRDLDVATVRRAMKELDIRCPVVVIFSPERKRDGTTGLLRVERGRHEILLFNARARTGANLSRTFWHEIVHALQREFGGDGAFIREYKTRAGRDDLEDEAWKLSRRLLARYGEVVR